MHESKYVFVFLEQNGAENKSECKCVGKVFLMVEIRSGFMGSLVYSLVKLWWH
jgi:hypothetical protein